MLVFLPLPEAERTDHKSHRYSHIECDVEGCGAVGKPEDGRSLMDMGWFIFPGRHRCPAHHEEDVPARGPQYRDE